MKFMKNTEAIRMRLSIIEMGKYKAIITLKSKKNIPFIAKIGGFDYSDQGTKVTLLRCEETIFPKEISTMKEASYVLFIKDIKDVDRYWGEPLQTPISTTATTPSQTIQNVPISNPLDKELKNLIEQMAGMHDVLPQSVGSETLSWKAHRIAEKNTSIEQCEQVLEFAETEADPRLRKMAYQFVCYTLVTTKHVRLAHQLLTFLPSEDDCEECLYTILIGIWESKIELQEQIGKVIIYRDDERDLIRNAAIRLIGSYTKNRQEAEEALLSNLEDPYDYYSLKYTLESLLRVGSLRAVKKLKVLQKNSSQMVFEEHQIELEQLISNLIKALSRK